MKHSAYFLIKHIVDDKFVYIERSEYPEQLGEYTLRCKKIDFNYSIKLFNEDKERINSDYVAGFHSLPIVSDKFKGIIEGLERNVQFNQVQLISGNSIDTNYWHAHFLNHLDVFDWEKSDYVVETWDEEKNDIIEWSPEQINDIPLSQLESKVLGKVIKIRIKEENIPENCHIFRVKGIETNIFISHELKSKIEEAQLVGIKLIEIG